VGAGDSGNQFGQDDRLAETGTTEQARLATTDEGRQQVDDLDACLKEFGLGREFRNWWSITVNRPAFLGLNLPAVVDRFSKHVEDAAKVSGPTGTLTGAPVSTTSCHE
jgi:hypothetical protein